MESSTINYLSHPNSNIFTVDRVDYNPDTYIRHVQICNGVIAIALEEGIVVLFRLDFPSDIDRIRVVSREGDSISGLFLDPSGNHLLVSLKSASTYYLNTCWARPRAPRLLLPFNGLVLNAVGWDQRCKDPTTTSEILLCSSDSVVWRTRIDARLHSPSPSAQLASTPSSASLGSPSSSSSSSAASPANSPAEALYLKSVFQIQPPLPLTAIFWSRFPSSPDASYVLLATPTRLYQFAGQGALAEIFLMYLESPVYREMPGLSSDLTATSSNLSVLASPDGAARSLTWITAQGLFYGELLPAFKNHQDSILTDTKLVPFPSPPSSHSAANKRELMLPELMFEIPNDVHLTPFHFLVLWPSSFQALSPISLTLVDSQDFSPAESALLKPAESFRGFVHDRSADTLWIYSSRSVFEVIISNEDRDIWELYLQKGMYAMALKFAQTKLQKQTILRSQSDHFLRRGDFTNAALLDAKTDQPFEEVALKFLHHNRKALKLYLLAKLEQLLLGLDQFAPRALESRTIELKSPPAPVSQIAMLCTWLVEQYLRELSRLQSKQRENPALHREFRDFLSKHVAYLDANTTFKLVASSGQLEELLFTASLLGFHERVISHLCRQNPPPPIPGATPESEYARRTAPFLRALAIFEKHLAHRIHAETIYKYAHTLFRHVPLETVSFWLNLGPAVIDPQRLLPLLVQYQPRHLPPNESENQPLRFLRAVCSRAWHCKAVPIHNYLISLYVRDADEGPLLQLLHSAEQVQDPQAYLPCFDHDYALRICLQAKKFRAAVILYGRMGLYDEAVELALRVDVELAKVQADKPPKHDHEWRRKLWHKIVNHVIRYDESITKAVDLMTQCPQYITIEDIMEYLPETSLIDDFKEEICRALEDYNRRINDLRNQMQSSTLSSKNAREEISWLKTSSGFVSQTQKCSLCDNSILSKTFYLFPCRHAFHTDCFLQESVKLASTKMFSSSSHPSSNFKSLFQSSPSLNLSSSNSTSSSSSSSLSSDCILCGDSMIATIDQPFFDSAELTTW